jgi:hypothetical protein
LNIVVAFPPMFEEIAAVFPAARGPGAIFTWGDTIYVPGGAHLLTPALRAHEGVHYSRQTNDTPKIEAWWQRYLVDAEFRLAEELPAHRAEYKQFCSTHRDRNLRIQFLHAIAGRLAGPLYGGMLSPAQARCRITG